MKSIAIKNKACLANTEDLFDMVQGACFFSKLDLALDSVGHFEFIVIDSAEETLFLPS